MNLLTQYFIALLVTGIINGCLGIFVLIKGRNKSLNQILALYSFSLCVWSVFEALGIVSNDAALALLLWRINHIGVIFIPIFLTHFVFLLLDIKGNKRKLIPISYAVACFFLILNATPLLILEVIPKFSFKHFINPGLLYYPFFLTWVGWAVYGNIELFREYFRTSGYRRNQMQYFCWSLLFSYIGGAPNFLPTFNIEIPVLMPYGTYAIPLYAFVTAYVMKKYHFMDINIVFARAGIFIFVYTLVLGIPFALATAGKPLLIRMFGINWWWMAALTLMAVLATAGPFIYIYIGHKAEKRLLTEQRRYHQILIQASGGMIRIRELGRLLSLTVHILTKTVRIKYAAIFLFDSSANAFVLKAGRGDKISVTHSIASDAPLIAFLRRKKVPVTPDEIRESYQDSRAADSAAVPEQLSKLKASLIVPIIIEDRLLGFTLLGEKHSRRGYTPEDIKIFSILGNQAALAIENAGFIDEFQKTQAQLFAAEQMASMGTMAGGMTHQINNRFHAIMMATSDTLDSMNFIDLGKAPDEIKKFLDEVKYALTRVQENAKHGGKIANDFLNFSQPERMKREAKEFDLREPIYRAIEMARLKTSFPEDTIEKLIPDEPFMMEGNFVLLQDAFFNLLDNAVDALKKMAEGIKKKEMAGPDDYKGKIIIKMAKMDGMIAVEFKDNGMGVSEDKKKNLFVPFFTTKATAAKGTGLGLYVIQRIIHAHRGQIKVESEYGRGTTFNITLPVK